MKKCPSVDYIIKDKFCYRASYCLQKEKPHRKTVANSKVQVSGHTRQEGKDKGKGFMERADRKSEGPPSAMNYPIVLVTWFDAKDGSSGWHSIEDVKKEKLATCYSTGWLVHHDSERVVIMADYSNEENDHDGGRHIAIPAGWVKSIAYLRKDYKKVYDQ